MVEIPIELARHLVFGAVDYANSLGFRPHADFKRAARHLGQWDETSAITFGNNGKVVYIPNGTVRSTAFWTRFARLSDADDLFCVLDADLDRPVHVHPGPV